MLREFAKEVGEKARDKLGQYVYDNVTSRLKDTAIVGKPIHGFHDYMFGTIEAKDNAEILELQFNVQQANEAFSKTIVTNGPGELWISYMKLENSNWLKLSNDALDTLNELQLDQTTMDQIHKDLPRTFPDLTLIQTPTFQLSLRKVLVGIANYLPEVGYVQGMNLICAYLLLHCSSEVKTFEMFASLLSSRKYNLRGVFVEGLPNVLAFVKLLEIIVKDTDNDLYEHLVGKGINQYVFVYQWVLTLFTYNMPFEQLEQFMTYFLQIGWEAFFKSSFVLMQCIKQDLYASDGDKCMELFQIAPMKVPSDFGNRIRNVTLKPSHTRLIDDIVLNHKSFVDIIVD